MPEKNKDKNPYSKRFENMAPQVGTASFQKNMSDELARLQQANRIQRQTVSSSYAQQYEQARGGMMRQQMAGSAPGLTGGLAQQRSSEISGAQMRGLSQLSGQREQALREVDYQGLMANREAFGFAQQQAMAGRDEQMFNLQMIQSRQDIINSDMSDEDKREALANTGMSPQDIEAQIDKKNQGFFDRLKSGEASPWAVGGLAGVGAAGVAGVGITGAQAASAYGAASAAATAGGKGMTVALANSLGLQNIGVVGAQEWAKTSFGGKVVKSLKTTKAAKGLKAVKAGKALKLFGLGAKGAALLSNPVGWAIIGTALVVGGVYAYNQYQKNR